MEIDIKQVLFQVINFSILLAVLAKFLYKPVLKMLKDREDKINDGLKAAESNLTAQEEIEKTKKAEITKARKEAAKILKEAKDDAKKQADMIISDAKSSAKEEAAKIIKKGEEQVQKEEKNLNNKLGQLLIATTENLLSSALSKSEIEKITKTTIKNL